MKGSICAVLAATAVAVSCKKQETVNPSLVTSTVEVMLGSPATKAFGDGLTLDHEKTLNNVTMFVYEATGADKDVCVEYHRFTDFELKQGKAVFTIEDVKEATKYDFYAVANCTSANLEKKNLTRPQLLAEFEGVDDNGESDYGSLTGYNSQNDDPNTDGFLALLNSAKRSGGFIMSGMQTATTPQKGTNVPTRVTVELRRTVAKVAIKAARTDNFFADDKYPKQSTFKITKAELKHLGRSSTLIASENPTVTERASVLWQNTHEEPAQPYNQFQNLFYIYENGVAGGTSSVTLKPELVLSAVFDYDGDPATTDDISKFTYTIKLSGELGQGTDETNKDFGRIVRNGNYVIDVQVNGLTETEVVAEIKVMDWEGPKFQTVNIGE